MSIEIVNKCLIQALKDGDADWIVHQVNCQGVMGNGIAKQIKEEFPSHFEKYREYCNNCTDLLGTVFAIDGVVGVFGQEYYGRKERHTNYVALISGIETFINNILVEFQYLTKIGVPYGIGSGLGGGHWDIVRTLLNDLQKMYPEVTITIYKL